MLVQNQNDNDLSTKILRNYALNWPGICKYYFDRVSQQGFCNRIRWPHSCQYIHTRFATNIYRICNLLRDMNDEGQKIFIVCHDIEYIPTLLINLVDSWSYSGKYTAYVSDQYYFWECKTIFVIGH